MNESTHSSYSAKFLSEVESAMKKIKTDSAQKLSEAIDLLYQAWKEDRWVYIMGNGGSASTATHLAADLAKTIRAKPEDKGIKALALVDNIPLVSALTNDWGRENIYQNQLSTFYVEGGVGIGISVHGGSGRDRAGKWSQNLLAGLQYIKDRGGKTIGLSGFDGGAMHDLADISIVIPAESTPIVEGLHVVIHHLLVFGLAEKIHEHRKKSSIS